MWRTVKLRPVSYFENSACQKLSLLKLSLPELSDNISTPSAFSNAIDVVGILACGR